MNRELTVWTICDGEPLPIDSGSPRLLRTAILSRRLAERGHRVIYWSSRFDHYSKTDRLPAPQRLDSGHGYQIHCVDRLAYPSNVSLRRFMHNKKVCRLMEVAMRDDKSRPDVIVADLPTIELAEMATRLGHEWSIPVIVCVRDLWPDVFYTALPNMAKPFGKILFSGPEAKAKRALAQATAICGISQGYLDWGLAKAGRDRQPRDTIIPLGYPDPPDMSPDERMTAMAGLKKRGVNPQKKLISFVGTFGRSYDLATVIKAAIDLEARYQDLQFVLCGDGERNDEWKKMASGVDSICFPGWVTQEEIACLLDSSTIGLAAYAKGAHQGLPNKFFEYMSFGLPVISSLSGEAKDEIKTVKFGLSFTAGDVSSLVTEISTLLDSPSLLAEMSHAARDRFEEKYQQSKVYTDYVEYVEDIASNFS